MLVMDLNGKWHMKRADMEDWMEARVPGSVYNDLMLQGKMPDPFYRDNEYEVLELSGFDYIYERDFDLSEDLLGHDRIVLLCEGLDTLCDVYINETMVLSANNMHRIYETDIKNFLVLGSNRIRAYFHSPVRYCLEKQKEYPLINSDCAVPGISHLRKAHYMFGWDWGPKLPDMGIWRNISIRGYDLARIDDVYITQIHDDSKVTLDVRVRTRNWSGITPRIEVSVTSPDNNVITGTSEARSGEEHIMIYIEDPKLWWPNNLGDQPLYNVAVDLYDGKKLLDTCSYRIGLRTIVVKQEKDQWGESFTFEVNGTAIFAMGANYIPEDNILARCNRDRTEKLIKSCVKANYNLIRVWGGGYYPDDYFYDLCDEYGIVVWQDLMFSCGVYSFTDGFRENVTREVIDNMKRIRHHASLGIWCGNNEQELGWVSWGWQENCLPGLKDDYVSQFETLLPEIAKEVDPNTFYWRSSPSSGGYFDDPNGEGRGDMHYWAVWHEKLPFTAYRNVSPRFMSEFGLQSFPCLETVEAFTLPEDRNIFSYVMESHQKNGTGNEKILYYISENFKYPKNFDSLLYVSQIVQAEGMRYGVEHWRRNRGRCMGALYWQINDCWPVASWSSIDYYGRWKVSHYAAKRFFSPILISACEDGTTVTLHISNETNRAVNGVLSWRLMDNRSRIIEKGEKMVTAEAFSSRQYQELDFSGLLDSIDKRRNTYLEFDYAVDGRAVSSGTVLFVRPKHFNFADPEISVEVAEQTDRFTIYVTSKSFAKFVELRLRGMDTLFSDNFFDLSAGYRKEVYIMKEDLNKAMSTNHIAEKITVRSIYDTYE